MTKKKNLIGRRRRMLLAAVRMVESMVELATFSSVQPGWSEALFVSTLRKIAVERRARA